MRYFHYISDSKLEMLSQQLPSKRHATKRAELGFNIGVINGKIGSDRNDLADRIDKLNAVEQHLRKHEPIGNINTPERWIEGVATAIASRINEDSNAVFYFIRTSNTYLALGGSVGNLISSYPGRKYAFGLSYAGSLIDSLTKINESSDLFFADDQFIAEYAECGVAGDHPWGAMIFSQCHHRRHSTFDFPIKFLARKILQDDYQGKRVVLASPLYVEEP